VFDLVAETSPVSFQTVPSDPLLKRVQTVGRVQPHVKAKVVDPNTGDVVPVNTPGELLVSGYLLQKGYYRNEEQTRKVMYQDKEKGEKEVWMHTGDEVVMDEEGYLSVVSRIKVALPHFVWFTFSMLMQWSGHHNTGRRELIPNPDREHTHFSSWDPRSCCCCRARLEIWRSGGCLDRTCRQ